MSSKISLLTARLAVIGAVYGALTIAIAPIAYGGVQVRISDAMLILPMLPYFGWDAVLGLTLGGFLGNLASPWGFVDWVFGPIANFFAALLMYLAKKAPGNEYARLILGIIASSLVVTLIIGYGELYLVLNTPEIFVLYVFIGEIISIGIGGTLVYLAFKKMRG